MAVLPREAGAPPETWVLIASSTCCNMGPRKLPITGIVAVLALNTGAFLSVQSVMKTSTDLRSLWQTLGRSATSSAKNGCFRTSTTKDTKDQEFQSSGMTSSVVSEMLQLR